jgi:hypothetical protein
MPKIQLKVVSVVGIRYPINHVYIHQLNLNVMDPNRTQLDFSWLNPAKLVKTEFPYTFLGKNKKTEER